MLLDQTNALVLDVAGDDARKRAAQVGSQFVGWHVERQLQRFHVGVGRVEWPLKALLDLQQPVEVKSIVTLTAEVFHLFQA